MGRRGGEAALTAARDSVSFHTRHQVARGARADAEVGDKLYLLKKVKALRATYQVRTLAFRAKQEGRVLVIRVPPGFRATSSLQALRKELGRSLRIEESES